MAQNVKLPIIIALVIAGILACSVFIYYQIVGGIADEEPPASPVPPAVESPPPAEPEPEIEVPPLDASDLVVRSLARTPPGACGRGSPTGWCRRT